MPGQQDATALMNLPFVLEVDEGWPPVAKECMPCSECGAGRYRILVPPLFIRELSVGDVVSVDRNGEGDVVAWSHVEKSSRTVVWIMVSGHYDISEALQTLRNLDCNVAEFEQFHYFAVDVPRECPMDGVDECLDALDEAHVAIAYPAFRH